MGRRELLTDEERRLLFGIPIDRDQLARLYTLSNSDRALIDARRRSSNRLGFAPQLALLRHPGIALQLSSAWPDELVAYLAGQLGLDASVVGDYARRGQTLTDHGRELAAALGLRPPVAADLAELVNAVLEADAQSADAARIAGNIEQWADGLFADIRELLRLAVEKRAHFALDLIQWTESVVELLLALATAPACDDHDREELRKHANWLVSNLSWLPTDEQTVRFVEGFRPAEHVFRIALSARRFEAPEVIDTCRKQLLKWALEAGAHQTGWGTLEDGLLALIALAAIDHELASPDQLKEQLPVKLALPNMPGQEIRDRAARDLRDKARTLRPRELEINVINGALTHGDIEATRSLILEVAAILSPGTVGEAPRRHLFG